MYPTIEGPRRRFFRYLAPVRTFSGLWLVWKIWDRTSWMAAMADDLEDDATGDAILCGGGRVYRDSEWQGQAI